MSRITVSLLASVMFAALTCVSAPAQKPAKVTNVPITEDQVVYEFVGQFNNNGSASQQFGYLSKVNGLDGIFNGEPENETTAILTFVTNANTDRVIVNGPFKIINRTGTTTIYLNTPPSDFTNPATFSQGTPIQVSDYSQQVILNTLHQQLRDGARKHNHQYLGVLFERRYIPIEPHGSSFWTTYSGQVNPTAPPERLVCEATRSE